MKHAFALIALAALMLAAWSASSGESLADSFWVLRSMPGYADLGPVEVTLIFDAEGAIGGNGGCNSYGGSYELNGENGIAFSQIFSTEMYCESNNASQIEQAYFEALSQAQSYSQDFESLRIQTTLGDMVFGVAP